jgi:uncharacterized protein (TIGR02118 family)
LLKIIFCLRRLPELSLEAFHRHWLEEHAPLVKRHAPTLGIVRYVQSHTCWDPRLAAPIDARGSRIEPYDGVAELWWDSIEDVVRAGSTPEGRRAGRELLSDERRFIDLPNSPIFYAREFDILKLT